MGLPEGYKHSDAIRLKMSECKKGNTNMLGKHPSEETKLKISNALKGKKRSEETKKKLRQARLGKHHSEETIEKIRLAGLDRKHTEETKLKIGLGNKGKIISEETKLKLSLNHADLRGEKGPRWQGGITPVNCIIRGSIEFSNWRTAVYERDNYTCQMCGSKKSGSFNAHHVKSFKEYPELRFDINNGITLCKPCHQNSGLHNKVLIA